MTKVIIYGEGGFCNYCDITHNHPLNNVVEEYEMNDPEPTQEELNRQSALDKLKALGLTEEEVLAILGSV